MSLPVSPHLTGIELDFVRKLQGKALKPIEIHDRFKAKRGEQGVVAPLLRNFRKTQGIRYKLRTLPFSRVEGFYHTLPLSDLDGQFCPVLYRFRTWARNFCPVLYRFRTSRASFVPYFIVFGPGRVIFVLYFTVFGAR